MHRYTPVYNPLTFGTVVRLLRSMCLHCGKFKMSAERVAAFAQRLKLIKKGDLEAGLHSLPGVRLLTFTCTWSILAVINWMCFDCKIT